MTSGIRRKTETSGSGRLFAGLLAALAFVLVGAQVSWTLRPYLGSAHQARFISPSDASLLDGVDATIDRVTGPLYPEGYSRGGHR